MIVSLSYRKLVTLDGIEFSEDIRKLSLANNRLTSLENVRFPKGLQKLWLHSNLLTSLDDVRFPNGLVMITLHNNQLRSLNNVHFPEGLQTLWFCKWDALNVTSSSLGNQLNSFNNLYISPATSVCSQGEYKIRKAVNVTCTQAIFGTPPLNPITLGAWWARVSYLTGGVTYMALDGAL